MMRTPEASFIHHSIAPYGMASALASCAFLVFFFLRMQTPLNVDTYLYAHAIQTFEGPNVHFGYYIIGAICHFLLEPLGVTPLQTLGYMSQFFGAVCVGGIYVFTFLLTNNRLQSLMTATILMFSWAFWLFSIHGEVYIPQLAFVLLSLIFLLERKPLFSSLSTLVAISITPTSILALIPLGYIVYMKDMRRKEILYFLMPILIAVIVLMSWNGRKVVEIFEKAVFSPTVFFEEFSYFGMLRKVLYDVTRTYGRSFNFISFFAIFGFITLYKNDRKLWGLMLAFLLPFLLYFLNLGLFSGDHLIISFIPVSLVGAYGLRRCLERVNTAFRVKFALVTLILALFAWISFEFAINRQLIYAKELQRVVQTLSEKYQKNGIMIADYNFGVSFWTLTREEKSKDILEGCPHVASNKPAAPDGPASDRLRDRFWISFACIPGFFSGTKYKSVIDERPIYLVERVDWPIAIVQSFKALLNRIGLERPVERPRKLDDIREYLEYKLGTHISTKQIVDSPLHPVYLMKAKHCRAK